MSSRQPRGSLRKHKKPGRGLRHIQIVNKNLVLDKIEDNTEDNGRDSKHIHEAPVIIRIPSIYPGKVHVSGLRHMAVGTKIAGISNFLKSLDIRR
jgi:hypothetical protein